MTKAPRSSKSDVHDLLIAKARRHAVLNANDELALRQLPFEMRSISSGEDVVCQGDRPDVSVFIMAGTLARYHTLPNGDRQYLALHITSDLPDVQALFLKVMDHSLCALSDAEIVLFRHAALIKAFAQRPNLAFAIWRATLVDSAIFRQAITNNSARAAVPRMAHFFCEQYFRAKEAHLADYAVCSLPMSQMQLGQTLGMSHISVNRALQHLREERLVEFRNGMLTIVDWRALVTRAGFDPTYLHAGIES